MEYQTVDKVGKSEKEQATVNSFNCFVIHWHLATYLMIASSSAAINRQGDDLETKFNY